MCSCNRHAARGGWWVIFLNKHDVKRTHRNVCEKRWCVKSFIVMLCRKYMEIIYAILTWQTVRYMIWYSWVNLCFVCKSAQEKWPQNVLWDKGFERLTCIFVRSFFLLYIERETCKNIMVRCCAKNSDKALCKIHKNNLTQS